ncbi:MAG: autotransporter outer membrane beta-barrel domain-containing protein, partial [Deltaproteobacteria bacterium]|nr:autotransporter outer membrane beta-barrel domain-containing protein [Deltaproteobacteria bacterium]
TDGNEHYNSKGSAHGELYDDFAFTAGLRRYYWDVYVDEAQTENPLMAHNYFTADATRIFSQSAGAALVAVNQNLNATLGAFDKVEMFGPVDQVHVGAYVGGGTVRAKTGSHVDVDSVSAALTVSKKTGHDLGETTLGLFGEFGHGNYDTFASIARYGDVMGDGNVNTYGGGFFFRTLFSQNTFIEASVRGGGIHNDYSLTRDPWIQNPGVHSYETNNSYYGAHLGLGQKFDLGDLTSLEGYGRYFWTRTHKDEFTTGFGDKVELDAVDSSRARLGARLNRSIAGGTVQFYVGAAAEHEFDGKITGRYAGDPISDPPKIKGTSGFGEIGLNIMPTGSRNFSINTEVFGLTGRQEGVGGSAAFSLNF